MEKGRKLSARKTGLALATAVILVGILWMALPHHRQPKPLVRLAQMTQAGYDRQGEKLIAPAQFLLPDSAHRRLKFGSVLSVETSWRFEVLTNNGTGFVPAGFQPEIGGFGVAPSGSNLQFYIRDARLLDCAWQLQVSSWRTCHIQTKLFGFNLDASPKQWISGPQPPARKWKAPSTSFSHRDPSPSFPEETTQLTHPADFPPLLTAESRLEWRLPQQTPLPK